MKRRTSTKEKGITLIALVVTIIILLILAGVVISAVIGNQGIIGRTKDATSRYSQSKAEEQVSLLMHEYTMENVEKGTTLGDFLERKKNDGTITDYKIKDDKTADITKDGYVVIIDDNGVTGSTKVADSDSGNSGGTSTSKGIGVSGTGTTMSKDSYPAITATGLIYADLDGNPSTAEGLVVATSDGSAVTSSSTMPDEYVMSDYAGESKTSSGKIITTTTKGGSNFYVLALADYDANVHYWWYNAYHKMTDSSTFTSTAIGQGKTNTSKMIDRVKKPSNYTVSYGDPITAKDTTYPYGPDMWYIIKDETDWFVPSKEEWVAFITNLTNNFSLTTSNYSNYGLSDGYWSSTRRQRFRCVAHQLITIQTLSQLLQQR